MFFDSRLPAVVLATFGLWLATPPAHGQVSSSDIANFHERALMQFAEGNYEAAVIDLKQVLQIEPDDLPSRLLLGRTYLRLGDGAAAEKEIRLLAQEQVDRSLVLIPLAKAYFIQGKYELLLEEVHIADESSDLSAEVSVLRGRALLALGEVDRAEGEFVFAATLNPDSPDPLIGQARCLMRRGHRERAQEVLERALAIAPDNADSWHLQAEFQRALDNHLPAIEAYTRAIEHDPFHMQARIGLAAALIDLDRDSEAQVHVAFVQEVLPTDTQARYLQALLLSRSGDGVGAQDALTAAAAELKALDNDFLNSHSPSLLLLGLISFASENDEEAYEYLSRFLNISPDHVAARKVLARTHLRLGEVIDAIRILEDTLTLVPDDLETRILLGDAYLKRGRYGDASRVFREAVRVNPGNQDLRLRLALTDAALGEMREALQSVQGVLSEDKEHETANLILARFHLVTGNYEKALRVARRAAEAEPGNPAPYNLAGAARFRQGDIEAARFAFEAALRADPDHMPTKLNLARLDSHIGEYERAEESYLKILDDHHAETRAMEGLAELALKQHNIEDAIQWRKKIRAVDTKTVKELLPLIDLYLSIDDRVSADSIASELTLRQPENVDVLLKVAEFQVATGNRADARLLLRKASRYAGYVTRRLNDIARRQIEVGDLESAKWTLRNAILGDPDFVPALRILTEVEIDLGSLDSALERTLALLESDPDNVLGLTLHGDVLHASGQLAEAAEAYEKALSLEPDAGTVVKLYGVVKELKSVSGATPILSEWLAENPEDSIVRRELASIFLESGDLEVARREHETLFAEFPEDVGILNNLAWIYARFGDERALEFAEQAYDANPGHPGVLDTLGWILVRDGQTDEGLRLLRKAFIRAPKQPEVRFHIAVALHKLGRDREAKIELEAALKNKQEFFDREEATQLLVELSAG